MCNKLKRRSLGIERITGTRKLRLRISLVNTRVNQADHNFRRKRDMHYHLLVHLRADTEVSIMARIRSTLRLDQPSPKVL